MCRNGEIKGPPKQGFLGSCCPFKHITVKQVQKKNTILLKRPKNDDEKKTHFNPPKKRKKQHHPKKGRNSKLHPQKKKKYHHPKKREEPPANSKKSGKKNPEFFGCQDHRGPTTTGATRRVEVTATEPSLPPSITEPRRTVPLGDETTKRRWEIPP